MSLDLNPTATDVRRIDPVCPANGRESSMQHGIPYDSTTVGGQAGGLVPNVFVVDIDVAQNLAGQQPSFEQSTDVSNVTARQT
ncbi:hypothetical protein CTI12_AA406170 [Artemisia annua]|uniref:Uncharacterized protein n=1 Tax=Artemisia annua TaxID=35608 RepID=A0A2U1M808_ARTAN|nr:hypothetical protein CTI12_AA406170 [Artemisia annua]